MTRLHLGFVVTMIVFSPLAYADNTLIYYQSTGELFAKGTPVVTPYATGYSGAGEHKNNPASQCIGDLGPIPLGTYTIGPMRDIALPDGHVIKNAIALTPATGNEMCKRTGFLIHGDNITFPGWASGGCIILTPQDRTKIAKARFKTLVVVTGKQL